MSDAPRVGEVRRGDPASTGVAVDVGSDAAAVVIVAPGSWAGREIEIESAKDGYRTHAEVGRRLTPRGVVFAAVLSGLPPGSYRLLLEPPRPLEVIAGSVTEVDVGSAGEPAVPGRHAGS